MYTLAQTTVLLHTCVLVHLLRGVNGTADGAPGIHFCLHLISALRECASSIIKLDVIKHTGE